MGRRKSTETDQVHQAGYLLKFNGALPDPNSWETAAPKTTDPVRAHHMATTKQMCLPWTTGYLPISSLKVTSDSAQGFIEL